MSGVVAGFARAGQQDLRAIEEAALQARLAGDLTKAAELYDHILTRDPRHGPALYGLGVLRLRQGDLPRARGLLQAAAASQPQDAQSQYSLGVVQQKLDDHAAATQSYRMALQLDPGLHQAWMNLGVALLELHQPEEAVAAQRQALQLDPESRDIRRNLATALHAAGRFDEAGAVLHDILAADPLDHDVLMQQFMYRQSLCDQAAWRDHEWRHSSLDWMKTDRPTLVPLPKWDGGSLAGKHIFFYGEQGIGDEIMYGSLLPAAAAGARRATLLCEARLVPLFARSMPGICVAARPPGGQPPVLDAASAGDLRCSLASLPLHAGPQALAALGRPFLHADPSAVAHWRARLAKLGGQLNVGISWRGGLRGANQALRSIELCDFAPLLALPGVRFVNVQYGSHPQAIAALNARAATPLVSFDEIDPLKDMDSLAALLSALDLVISVDNSTVHLAGALGVPTWMLCAWNPDWRWQHHGERNRWYDSVRLFRQAASNRDDWQEVLRRIEAELRAHTARQPATAIESAPPVARAAAPQPTVLLLNDTSYWSHWGCAASSLAVHQGLRAAGHAVDSVQHVHCASIGAAPRDAAGLDDAALFQRFQQQNPGFPERLAAVPEVVINGDMHLRGQGEPARCLLYLAWLAKHRYGKRVSIINHLVLPGAAEGLYARVYQAMDFVAVNDEASALLLERLGVRVTRAADCLALFATAQGYRPGGTRDGRVVFSGLLARDPQVAHLTVAIAESALAHGHRVEFVTGAAAYAAADDRKLAALLQQRLAGRHALRAVHSESEWFAALAGASLVVTGRRQHALAAVCLGTPFVTVSGSEPVDGIFELGPTSGPVMVSPHDIPQATTRVLQLLQDPRMALVPESSLPRLRALAQRNFAPYLATAPGA